MLLLPRSTRGIQIEGEVDDDDDDDEVMSVMTLREDAVEPSNGTSDRIQGDSIHGQYR